MMTNTILIAGPAITALVPFSGCAWNPGPELLKPNAIAAGTTRSAPPSANQVK
jgi:hypothetical protein